MTKTKLKALSWIPQRRGRIYCAPACGGGCTVAEYEKVKRDGNTALRRMNGSGWKLIVHENLGWHWRIVSGPVQVHQSFDGGAFYAMINRKADQDIGGAPEWTERGSPNFRDPNRAVRYALSIMERVLAQYDEARKAARAAAGLE